jgi:23S rRNA (adenine2503-C2)-methyltransferase
MPGKIDLLDMERPEMAEAVAALGEKPFRARQLWKWLYAGVLNFELMTDLSSAFRSRLMENHVAGGLTLVGKQVSSQDETTKFLFSLQDGNLVESVLMRYRYGLSACISTQVGCRMGCAFCASSPLGLVRNLTIGEMTGQVLLMMQAGGERIGHVVLMGIGEPFDNYGNVMSLLHRLNREDTLAISHRKLTVSTCGMVPAILRFAGEGIPVNLSVSLHAPTQELREQVMPIAKKWPLPELLDACWKYVDITGRRITFEYALVRGWNDSPAQARMLAALCRNRLCHVNLIPVNPVPGTSFKQGTMAGIHSFAHILEENGIAATIRRELGSDIEAACGQLRRTVLQQPGKGAQ